MPWIFVIVGRNPSAHYRKRVSYVRGSAVNSLWMGLGSNWVSDTNTDLNSGTRNGTQHANDPSTIESYGACLASEVEMRIFIQKKELLSAVDPLQANCGNCLVPRTIDSIDGIILIDTTTISSSCNHPHCGLYSR